MTIVSIIGNNNHLQTSLVWHKARSMRHPVEIEFIKNGKLTIIPHEAH